MRIPCILVLVIVFFSTNNCAGICIGGFGDCYCDYSGSTAGCDELYNTIKDTNDPNDWRAFFNPKIHVRPSSGCYFWHDTNLAMSVGGCGYSCPRRVAVFRTTCDPPGSNTTAANYNPKGE